MPLQLPNLDDRRYTDLVEEARSLIPTYAPEWTNHNPTDPGITLVDLFAFLSEMLLYRLNRVTSANVLSFLKLLNGPAWKPLGKEPGQLTPPEIAQQVPKTILKMRKLERAVSCKDFEDLALEADPGRVARALCLPRLNMAFDTKQEQPGHVSLIILPKADPEFDLAGLIASVATYLTPKLLLTTRLHVFGPQFLTVGLHVTVVPLPDELESNLKDRIVHAVRKFLDPWIGGEDTNGWPFGRNVFLSELYGLLDRVEGVDYITTISLTPDSRLISKIAGEPIGLEVRPYELVRVQMVPSDVTVQVP